MLVGMAGEVQMLSFL